MKLLPFILLISCLSLRATSAADEPFKAPIKNRAPLQQNVFDPLPLGAIEAKGWLRKQLEIQAAGLTGHFDEFWEDVGRTAGG